MMADKPKVGFYWCGSCGGCEETVVDLDEKVLDVVAAVDIAFWPVALDFKYSHVEAMADGELACTFINGAIRTSEQEHIAKLLRKKSAAIIAFGSCAVSGGIPALANLTNKEKIYHRSYHNSPTVVNPDKTEPQLKSKNQGYQLELPDFYETVYQLSDVIDVDYYLPGCPPTPGLIVTAVTALLEGNLPAKGAVLLPNKSLCGSCSRNETKPDNITVGELKRIYQIQADPEKCFLAQGVLCMGPSTRDGCEYPCVKGNMPCSGCFGPVEGADQGAKMLSALGGILEGETDRAIAESVSKLPDPAGYFYRYSLSDSLLGSQREEK